MKSKRRQLTVRLSSDLDEKLQFISEKMGISKNAYILIALNKQLKEGA